MSVVFFELINGEMSANDPKLYYYKCMLISFTVILALKIPYHIFILR